MGCLYVALECVWCNGTVVRMVQVCEVTWSPPFGGGGPPFSFTQLEQMAFLFCHITPVHRRPPHLCRGLEAVYAGTSKGYSNRSCHQRPHPSQPELPRCAPACEVGAKTLDLIRPAMLMPCQKSPRTTAHCCTKAVCSSSKGGSHTKLHCGKVEKREKWKRIRAGNAPPPPLSLSYVCSSHLVLGANFPYTIEHPDVPLSTKMPISVIFRSGSPRFRCSTCRFRWLLTIRWRIPSLTWSRHSGPSFLKKGWVSCGSRFLRVA